jgi:hypothetical protein
MEIDQNIQEDQNKINSEAAEIPLSVEEKPKPEGYIAPDLLKIIYPPINPNGNLGATLVGFSNFPMYYGDAVFNSDNTPTIQFEIKESSNFLDTRELCLEGIIENPHEYPLSADNSFHSIIKSIMIYKNNNELIEVIKDYDSECALYFDQTLSIGERILRRKNEGFGINKWGSDTGIVGEYISSRVPNEHENNDNNLAKNLFSEPFEVNQKVLKRLQKEINENVLYLNHVKNVMGEGYNIMNQYNYIKDDENKFVFSFSSEQNNANNKLLSKKFVIDLKNHFNGILFASTEALIHLEDEKYNVTPLKLKLNDLARVIAKISMYDPNEGEDTYMLNFIAAYTAADDFYGNLDKNFCLAQLPLIRIPKMGDWQETQNGKLLPKKFLPKDNTNRKAFKIPLMVRSIGALCRPEYYRPLPLGIFKGGLKIVITLNQFAFSVDFSLTSQSLAKLHISEILRLNKVNAEVMKSNAIKARSYKLLELHLSTVQYRYSDAEMTESMRLIRAGQFHQGYTQLIQLDQTYFKPTPDCRYTGNRNLTDVRRILMTITSDIGVYSPYARVLDRYNRGISKFVFRQAGGQYPPITMEKYNSLNTYGEDNSSFFYQELLKGLQYHPLEKDIFLTKTNFSVNFNYFTQAALIHLKSNPSLHENFKIDEPNADAINKQLSIGTKLSDETNEVFERNATIQEESFFLNSFDKKWYECFKDVGEKLKNTANLAILKTFWDEYNFDEKIDNICSKTIYSLHFEKIPNNYGTIVEGITTRADTPFYIEFSRVPQYHKIDYYQKFPSLFFTCTYYAEVHRTAGFSPNGDWVNT